MAITTQIPSLPTPPDSNDKVNFRVRADNFVGALPDFGNKINQWATEANFVEDEINNWLGNKDKAYVRMYLGPKDSDPTARNDTTTLQVGDLFFDTTINKMKVWDGSQWQLASSAVNGLLKKTQFTGDGTTTSFAVTDGFDANYGIVFLNGVDVTKDVDISDGQNIKFNTAPANGDETTAYFFGSFRVADVYTKSEIDAGNIVLNAIKNVDGSGSGLDADKLDGLNSSQFVRSDTNDTISGWIKSTKTGKSFSFGAQTSILPSSSIANQTTFIELQAGSGGDTNSNGIVLHNPGTSTSAIEYVNTNIDNGYFNFKSDDKIWDVRINGNKVWHAGDGVASKASNGYQKLPSGLIIQWGAYSSTSSANTFDKVSVTFPISFPNAVISVIGSCGSGNINNNFINITFESQSTSGFTGVRADAVGMDYSVQWFAIGY
jgi:hypothetical protein